MRRAEIVVASPRSSASSTIALSAKRSRAQQALQLPAFLQFVDPPEGRDHLLAHRRALAPALDDLQIGAAARGLLAEIHGGKPEADSMPVRTESVCIPTKSSKIDEKRGTTFSCPLTLRSSHINDLRNARRRQLLKISLRTCSKGAVGPTMLAGQSVAGL